MNPRKKPFWLTKIRQERRSKGLCAECGGQIDPIKPMAKRPRGRPRSGYRCSTCIAKRSLSPASQKVRAKKVQVLSQEP